MPYLNPENLRNIRISRNFTQSGFAQACGLRLKEIARWETIGGHVQSHTALALATLLSCRIGDITDATGGGI